MIETPRFSHQDIMRVLGGILLCLLLAAIDQTVVIPAVPAIAADLNGFGHLSWILSAYLLTATAATPLYGKLSDIYGRRALLLPALLVFVAASALCASAQSLVQLILFRALQGLGGGGLMAMSQAVIADIVAPRERGRYQGYMASVWGLASVAGPILGGWVTDHLSWRWIFWINLPIGVVAILLCNRSLKRLVVQSQRVRIDWLGAALLTGAVTAWLLLLSWGGVEMPWNSAPIIGLALLGAVLIAWLVVQERRVADPLLPPRLFTHPVFVRGVVVGFLCAMVLFGASFMLPLFFQLIGGADASRSGVLVVPFLGATCVGAYASGQAARRIGKMKGVLLSGLAVCLFGFLLLTTLSAETPMSLTMLYTLVLGLGLGATLPSSLVIVQNAAERRDVGVATGSLLFLRSMGGAFGTTVVGAVLLMRFGRSLAELGITAHLDLDAVRTQSGALQGLGAPARQAIASGLTGGFHLAFLVCAIAMAAALAVAGGMRDLPLRATNEPAALAH